jgi:RNA polymerase sigma-70 factor (ECF subfamily)
MHSNSTDAELLARAVEEPVLFAALFERHGQAVRRYAIRRIGEAGDDVASEVFVRAFRGRAGYRADHDEALPWLLGIANNVIADHRRLERRRLAALEHLTREVPQVIEHGESGLAPELVAALRALPAVERDTLLLVVWGELTQEQAAVAVGVPVGTISSRITRARKRLMTTSLRSGRPAGTAELQLNGGSHA